MSCTLGPIKYSNWTYNILTSVILEHDITIEEVCGTYV